MKNNFKLKYESPKIEVITVQLEVGIAATSSSLQFGGADPNNPNNPIIDEWDDDGGQTSSFDIL